MVRLADILKREEIGRVDFSTHRPQAAKEFAHPGTTLSAENIYAQLCGLIRQALSDVLNAQPLNIALVREKINLLLEYVSSDEADLLRLIDRYDVAEDYLVIHSVNVCILSLEIARGLKYKRDQLQEIGIGALLHDIGMSKVKSILDKERRLYNAEYEEVKNHVSYGASILRNSGETNENILAVIEQHHERMDGSGYLQGRSSESTHEYSRIVGLADVYEALIHSRPHRERLAPFEYKTIREIISHREIFDPYILRVFIERLTKQPSYMLWLLTDSVSQILEQRKGPAPETRLITQKVSAKKAKFFIIAISAALSVLAGVLIFSFLGRPVKKIISPQAEGLYVAQNKMPLKLAYDFSKNTADAYTLGLDLSGLDLGNYALLAFSAKIEEAAGYVTRGRPQSVKIEIENARKEKAEYYLQDIEKAWTNYHIPLSNFDKIIDWSNLKSIYFGLQPWNMASRKGSVYIDNIRFLRKEK